MKHKACFIALFLYVTQFAVANNYPILNPSPDSSVFILSNSIEIEICQIYEKYEARINEINLLLESNRELIAKHRIKFNAITYIKALEEKIRLQEELRQTEADIYVDLLRVRYLKGLDLIKLLYEKVLSLDHHFATMQTFQHVSALSNPNSYPAFQQNHKPMRNSTH